MVNGDRQRHQFWGKHVRPAARPTFWAILYRDNGSLEFLSLPDFTLKYVVLNFHMGESRTTSLQGDRVCDPIFKDS